MLLRWLDYDVTYTEPRNDHDKILIIGPTDFRGDLDSTRQQSMSVFDDGSLFSKDDWTHEPFLVHHAKTRTFFCINRINP